MNKQNPVLQILGENIIAGESKEINFHIAKLHTRTLVDVPVIINRSKKPGPVVLFIAGIHGDEVNGIEIVRQIVAKGINKPKKGTIIIATSLKRTLASDRSSIENLPAK